MKIRWVTLLMIAAMISTAVVFAQSPIAIKPESTVKVAPIATTQDGYDTGITVVNMTNNPLRIENFKFYSVSGTAATGIEAAQAEAVNRKMAAASYPIPGNGRFSMLLSQLFGTGLNGQLRFNIVGPGAISALVYEATINLDWTVSYIKVEELTHQHASPQN